MTPISQNLIFLTFTLHPLACKGHAFVFPEVGILMIRTGDVANQMWYSFHCTNESTLSCCHALGQVGFCQGWNPAWETVDYGYLLYALCPMNIEWSLMSSHWAEGWARMKGCHWGTWIGEDQEEVYGPVSLVLLFWIIRNN